MLAVDLLRKFEDDVQIAQYRILIGEFRAAMRPVVADAYHIADALPFARW